jgi:uncharacterized protein YdeI (YjbR/CyaY-like superfamily)
MPAYDPRIDVYIEEAAGFAQPVLHHLRELIHKHCPDVTETMKWSFPHFVYKDRNVFSMAAFKQHCAFGFNLASVMTDPQGLLETEDKAAMGSLGRITALKDLPSDKVLAQYFKQTIKLVDEGVKVPKPQKKAEAPPMEVPDYFIAALKKNKKALAVFEAFAPSHRKEYLEWIKEAKRQETRDKRIAQAIEWMSEGKGRHWKYER